MAASGSVSPLTPIVKTLTRSLGTGLKVFVRKECLPGGIPEARSIGLCKLREAVRPALAGAMLVVEDVGDIQAANVKRVRDKRAVTTPGHRLRAHDRGGRLGCESQQRVQARGEFRRLHVIRVPTKARVHPTPIETPVLQRFTKAAERGQPAIGNGPVLKCPREALTRKLRIVSRFGDGADVGQGRNSVPGQNPEKTIQRQGGMADRQHRLG
jgi:hypothetical protein